MNTLHGIRRSYDAVVIGARCAGAATALRLARAGAKVLLVDRQAYGSDTMSTHAVMRGGVLLLNRWGLAPRLFAAGTPAIRATTFHYGDESVRVDIKPDPDVDCLYAPRRSVLDAQLVDAAFEAGADVRHGVALSDLQIAPGGRVNGVELRDASGARASVRADIVVGADGRQSTVARLVGAKPYVEGRNATAIVYGYFENLSSSGCHWYFAANAAAGAIPTNGGHCVFAGVPAQRFSATFGGDVLRGFQQTLAANSPKLREHVGRANLIGRLRGFGGATSFLRECHGPGWALVGDAGYYKDPLTAHGITDALRDANALAREIMAVQTRSLAAYQSERDQLALPFLRTTDAIASFSWEIEQIQQLHRELSALMKAEANHIASSFPLPRAA